MTARAHLQVCEDHSGEPCEDTELGALPEDWTVVGEIVGVVYRNPETGQAYMHAVRDGDLMAAPGFLLVEADGIEPDARGLVGSEELRA